MEKLEEVNARLVEDVNNGESEKRDENDAAMNTEKLKDKIAITIDTIKGLTKRKAELIAKNDILMAP